MPSAELGGSDTVSDQIGLFDAPEPELAPPASARGRTRETFARSVTYEVAVVDGEALRAGARETLDNVVVIDLPQAGDDEMDVVPDQDLADPDEDIEADHALALEWCLEPTQGLETVAAGAGTGNVR